MGAEKETTDQVLTYSAQNGYSSGGKNMKETRGNAMIILRLRVSSKISLKSTWQSPQDGPETFHATIFDASGHRTFKP